MNNNKFIRTWSDLYGLTVVTAGKRLGTVEDFYFEPETNAVRALRINTGILGYRELMASAIKAIGLNTITIANEYMLAEERTDGRLPTALSGQSLLSYKVISEKGKLVGKVSNVLIDTSTPMTLRVVGFELGGDSRGRHPIFAAKEVTAYEGDTMYILDKVAKQL